MTRLSTLLACICAALLLVLCFASSTVEAHGARHRHSGSSYGAALSKRSSQAAAAAAELNVDETCANAAANPPRIWSYHVHFLFDANDKNATLTSLQIRDDFIAAHHPNKTQCSTLYQGLEGLCMFAVEMAADGPFMQAQWAVYVPLDQFVSVVPWFLQHHAQSGLISTAGPPGIPRPPFSVLVHPCTGCEYEDHGIWALWAGQPAQISMAAMTEEVPFDVIPPNDPRCISC